MAYAAKADLVPRRLSLEELTQLTDDNKSGKLVDQTVTDILTEASGTVDSYCRQRYTVPLQSSEQVKAITLDIAVYRLFLRKRRVSADIQLANDNAISFLRDVAKGNASLDQPVGAPAQTTQGSAVGTQKPERFSDDNLKGFA
jgi:phage gp36-like protein